VLTFGIDQHSVVDLVPLERIRHMHSPVTVLLGTISRICSFGTSQNAALLACVGPGEAIEGRNSVGVDRDRRRRLHRQGERTQARSELRELPGRRGSGCREGESCRIEAEGETIECCNEALAGCL
jgi:hypothetical protein